MAQQKKKKSSKPQSRPQQQSPKTAPQKIQKPQRNPVTSRMFFNFFTAIIWFGVAVYYYSKGESDHALTMVLAGVAFLIVGGVHLYRSKKSK